MLDIAIFLALAGVGVPVLICLYKRAAREDARDERIREK